MIRVRVLYRVDMWVSLVWRRTRKLNLSRAPRPGIQIALEWEHFVSMKIEPMYEPELDFKERIEISFLTTVSIQLLN